MIVTEEEAKTKRCQESFPAAEALSLDGSSVAVSVPMHTVGFPYGSNGPAVSYGSSMAKHTAPTNCIGSACMAWRWHNDDLSDYPPNTKGFCGKAGP